MTFIEPSAVDRLHNRPPEPIVPEDDERVAALVRNATKLTEQHSVVETDELAAVIADVINQLDAQWEAFDGKRKAEREPHNQALKAIQEKWLPRLERIDICRRAIKPLHRAWLKLKDARLKAERDAKAHEAAEAQRTADQLAEQAAGGGPSAVPNMIGAAEAAAEAAKARQAVAAVPQRAQVRGNLGGRTHSLRTVYHASIVEQDLCYGHFRYHADVKALLQRLANAAARGGTRNPDLPGCWIYDTQE